MIGRNFNGGRTERIELGPDDWVRSGLDGDRGVRMNAATAAADIDSCGPRLARAAGLPDRVAIGPWEYRVKLVRGLIFYGNGRRAIGLCDEATRTITISDTVPPERRPLVLLHEIAHAWIFATGEPADVEGWCDLISTVAVAAYRDIGSLLDEVR